MGRATTREFSRAVYSFNRQAHDSQEANSRYVARRKMHTLRNTRLT